MAATLEKLACGSTVNIRLHPERRAPSSRQQQSATGALGSMISAAQSLKGWTGPKEVDGHKVRKRLLARPSQASAKAFAGVRENPAHLQILEDWLHSYRPGGVVR